jgi:hypothetical protein
LQQKKEKKQKLKLWKEKVVGKERGQTKGILHFDNNNT